MRVPTSSRKHLGLPASEPAATATKGFCEARSENARFTRCRRGEPRPRSCGSRSPREACSMAVPPISEVCSSACTVLAARSRAAPLAWGSGGEEQPSEYCVTGGGPSVTARGSALWSLQEPQAGPVSDCSPRGSVALGFSVSIFPDLLEGRAMAPLSWCPRPARSPGLARGWDSRVTAELIGGVNSWLQDGRESWGMEGPLGLPRSA